MFGDQISEKMAIQLIHLYFCHRYRVETDLAPVCKEFGIGLTTFSPVYYEILTGKYNEGIPKGTRADRDGYAWIRERITSERIVIVEMLTEVAAHG
jgi:aryl-alcohol dehydrogenase-like predicted oxidoreductase